MTSTNDATGPTPTMATDAATESRSPASQNGPTEKRGYCTLCRSRCGTVNVIERDMLLAVRPDPGHPTGHAMCLKGKSAPELVHSAERILHPMRRTNSKHDPDPGWVRISWEEALSEVAARLGSARREGGGESVAFAVTTPSGTPLTDSIDWIERFIRTFGSPNTCYATEICNWHKDHAHAFTFGGGMATADYSRAELILLWGHNPTNTWLSQADAIGAGLRDGARMIVVDPRQTSLAGKADQWLRVRPGTDTALAMALANLLIESSAFDIEFVRRWTNGPLLVRDDNGEFLRGHDLGWTDADTYVVWDAQASLPVSSDVLADGDQPRVALRGEFAVQGRLDRGAGARSGVGSGMSSGIRSGGRAGAGADAPAVPVIACKPAFERYAIECARYPVELASAITWIPEADIRHAASLIGAAGRIAYHAWSGVAQQDHATQADRAIACLYALTGSFDRNGGNRIYAKAPHRSVNGFDLLPAGQREKALGYAARPLGPPSQGWVTARDLYDAVLSAKPYRIGTLMAFGSNLLLSQADVVRGEQALVALDFYVHCDLFETPSARFADILLPVNTPWEREGLRIGFEISADAERLVQLRQRMVSPRGESRSDNEIVFDLAMRLGMDDAFFGGSLEAGWNHMLAPSGLTVAMLRDQPEGIRVPVDDVERKYAGKPRGTAFNTPTGLIELYSERLLRHGYPAVPTYDLSAGKRGHGARDAAQYEAQDERFPLLLTSAKSGYYCHSQHRSLASLRRKALLPQLELSEELAVSRGIREGDGVRVSTANGSARFVAHISAGLHPGVVAGEYGWWQRCDVLGQGETAASGPQSSNYNALIDAGQIDPVSGSVPMRASCCNVERDEEEGAKRGGWQGYRVFRVASRVNEAPDVASVYMEPADGKPLPDFMPGQHVTIRLQVDGGAGAPAREIVRSYSLTGPAVVPDRGGYAIAVRRASGVAADGRVVHGVASTHINLHLRAGDLVGLRPPSGTFIMPTATRRPLVLMAGGIGITPFMSFLESVAGKRALPKILLLYANRNLASHAFGARIAALRAAMPSLVVVDFHDSPEEHERLGVDYHIAGRITADHVPAALLQQRPLFYTCGPVPMMAAFANALAARGVPRFDILKETFRSPPLARPAPGLHYRVRFAKSGVVRQWQSADGPLLGFAERLGLSLPSGCRVGQCESCAVPVVSGSVMHLHGEEPEDAAVCLVCQAVPTSDLVLDA